MKLAPWNVCRWGTTWSTAVPNTMERPMCHIPHSGDTITISSLAQLEDAPHSAPRLPVQLLEWQAGSAGSGQHMSPCLHLGSKVKLKGSEVFDTFIFGNRNMASC